MTPDKIVGLPGIAKNLRIGHRSDFERLRLEGLSSTSRSAVLVWLDAPSTRFGVICSKRYSLLSVERNRARRLLWESFRLIAPHLIRTGMILAIVRKGMAGKKRQEVTSDLLKMLKKQRAVPEDLTLDQATR